ncbi:MAG TPA: hypothetical protein VG125_03855, partial [Pirellulales bacterium]|nr:hypothetical protein [Pirellulales bacterium]
MRSRKSHSARKPRRATGYRRFTTLERALHGAALSLLPGRYDPLLFFERLEDRRLLAASPLVIDLSAATQADAILINLDASGTNLQVTVNGNQVQNVPLANVSQLSVLGSSQDDTLTVDSSNGDPIPSGGLNFNGDAGGLQPGENNTLVLRGGSYTNESYSPLSQHSGTITLDKSTIAYENLTPLVDTTPASSITVFATNGNDTISYTPGISDPLHDGLVAVNTFETIEFSNKSNLTIDGLSGTDTINLNCQITPTGLTSIAVNGNGTSSDTLIANGSGGADSITVQPIDSRSASINGAGPVAINAAALDHLVVDGHSGNVALTYEVSGANALLTFTPGATANSGTIEGRYSSSGGGGTLLPVTYTDIAVGGSLTFSRVAFEGQSGRQDSLTVEGTTGNDTFTATPTYVQLTQAGNPNPIVTSLRLYTPGIANLHLAGMGGDDTFGLYAGLPYTATFVDGSGATDPPTVNLISDGTATTANLGAGQFSATVATMTGGGLGSVTMSGVGVVNVFDGANSQGTGGMTVTGQPTTAENFVVTPGVGGAAIQDMNPNPVFSLSPTVNYVGVGVVTVAADGPPVDGDTLTINCNPVPGPGVAPLTVTSTQVLASGDTPINYTAANFVGLHIIGLPAFNQFIVDNTNGFVPVPIHFDGGALDANSVTVKGGTAREESYLPGPSRGQGSLELNFLAGIENVFFSNTFEIDDYVPSRSLDVGGTSGSNHISYVGNGSNVSAPIVYVNDLTPIAFSQTSSLVIRCSGVDNNITLNTAVTPPGLKAIFVDGKPDSTTALTVNGGPNQNITFAPSDGHSAIITGAGAVPINVLSVNQVTIDGDQSGDNLTVTMPVGPANENAITFTPGATASAGSVTLREVQGVALLPVAYTNFSRSGSLSLAHAGGGRTDQLYVSGSAVNDVFNLNTSVADRFELDNLSGGVLVAATLDINTSGISDLTLDGS